MDIKEISHETFYNMQKYFQLTIDYVEEVEDILTGEFEKEQDRIDFIGSLCYRIEILLEVINPNFKDDIKILKELSTILNNLLD